jgi:hypothetical protein
MSDAGFRINVAVLKHPSAFIPLAMSLAALVVVLSHIAISGIAREADEGTAAHLFQMLVAGQIPVVAVFATRWLRRARRDALSILALQAGAIGLVLALVFLLGL